MPKKSNPSMPKTNLSKLNFLKLEYVPLVLNGKLLGHGYKLNGVGDADGAIEITQDDAEQFAHELAAVAALIHAHAPKRKMKSQD